MDRVQVVVVRLGQQPFAMLLTQVENVVAANEGRLEQQQMSGTMPLWLSPLRLRYLGERLPIVELGRKLGIATTGTLLNGEMVIAGVGSGVRCALVVDQAQVIAQTELDRITPLPRWLSRETAIVWGSYINGEGEVVLMLDCEALFTSTERSWLAIS